MIEAIIVLNLVSLHWVGDDSISSTDITIPSSCLVKPAHRLEIGSAKISSFTGVGLLVGDMRTMYMVNDIKRGNLTWCLWWEWVHGRWPIPLSLSPAASLDGSSQLHSQLSHSWGWTIIKQLWIKLSTNMRRSLTGSSQFWLFSHHWRTTTSAFGTPTTFKLFRIFYNKKLSLHWLMSLLTKNPIQ